MSPVRAARDRALALARLADAITIETRGGSGTLRAVIDVARTHPELQAVADGLDRGDDPESVLGAWAAAGDADARALAAALVLALGGGPASVLLGGVARTLRARAALADEVRALSASARASAVVVAAAPVGAVVLGAVADPASVLALVTQPIGRLALAVGVVFEAAGVWITRRLLHRFA